MDSDAFKQPEMGTGHPDFTWSKGWQEKHSQLIEAARFAPPEMMRVIHQSLTEAISDQWSFHDLRRILETRLCAAGLGTIPLGDCR